MCSPQVRWVPEGPGTYHMFQPRAHWSPPGIRFAIDLVRREGLAWCATQRARGGIEEGRNKLAVWWASVLLALQLPLSEALDVNMKAVNVGPRAVACELNL
jgi:hypothetical protein